MKNVCLKFYAAENLKEALRVYKLNLLFVRYAVEAGVI